MEEVEQQYQVRRFVDSREPPEIKDKLMMAGFEQKALACGDVFMFTANYKKVGIERKTVPDLLASLGDRLASQLYRMTEFYDVSILMIEGKLTKGAQPGQPDVVVTDRGFSNWGWCTLWNFLQTWQGQGVTIQLTTSLEHTLQRISELYVYYQKQSHAGGVKRTMTSDDRVLALGKGTGEKTGLKILGKFGTLKAVANASVQDLLAVEDVGPKRANSIFSHFNRESNGKES